MIHKATDGRGTWYGSLDGETWVLFPVEPMAGDEKNIQADLNAMAKPILTLRARLRLVPVTWEELVKRGFTFSKAGK
jgi:hypothetical protein